MRRWLWAWSPLCESCWEPPQWVRCLMKAGLASCPSAQMLWTDARLDRRSESFESLKKTKKQQPQGWRRGVLHDCLRSESPFKCVRPSSPPPSSLLQILAKKQENDRAFCCPSPPGRYKQVGAR